MPPADSRREWSSSVSSWELICLTSLHRRILFLLNSAIYYLYSSAMSHKTIISKYSNNRLAIRLAISKNQVSHACICTSSTMRYIYICGHFHKHILLLVPCFFFEETTGTLFDNQIVSLTYFHWLYTNMRKLDVRFC